MIDRHWDVGRGLSSIGEQGFSASSRGSNNKIRVPPSCRHTRPSDIACPLQQSTHAMRCQARGAAQIAVDMMDNAAQPIHSLSHPGRTKVR
jgi:hypothetical protein